VVHGIRNFWLDAPPPAYPMKMSTSELHGIRSLFSLGFAIFVVTPSLPATPVYIAARHPSTRSSTTLISHVRVNAPPKPFVHNSLPVSASTLRQSWSFHCWLTKGNYAQRAQVQDDKKHRIVPLAPASSSLAQSDGSPAPVHNTHFLCPRHRSTKAGLSTAG
jgi:hypothetical protein